MYPDESIFPLISLETSRLLSRQQIDLTQKQYIIDSDYYQVIIKSNIKYTKYQPNMSTHKKLHVGISRKHKLKNISRTVKEKSVINKKILNKENCLIRNSLMSVAENTICY